MEDCLERNAEEIGLCLELYLVDNPNNTEARIAKARWHLQLGDFSSALQEVDKGLVFDPEDIRLHLLRAQLLKRSGDPKGATEEGHIVRSLRKQRMVLLLEDPDADSLAIRVEAQRAKAIGDFGNARKLYEKYFELVEHPYPLNLGDYAEVLARQGEYEEALGVMERAFALMDHEDLDLDLQVSLLETRAAIREWSGDERGAVADRQEIEASMSIIRGRAEQEQP